METIDYSSFEDSILPKIYFSNIAIENANIDQTTTFESDTAEEYSKNILKKKNIYGKSQYSTQKPTNEIISFINQDNKEIKIDYTVVMTSGLLNTDFIEKKLHFCFMLAKNKQVIDIIKAGNYSFQDLNNFVISKDIDIISIPIKEIDKSSISTIGENEKVFFKLDGVIKFYLNKNYKNLAIFSFSGVILTSEVLPIKNKILLNYNKFGPINAEMIYQDGTIPEVTNQFLGINGNAWGGTYHEMLDDAFRPQANTDQNYQITRDYLINTVRSSGPVLENSKFMKGAKHNPRNIIEENRNISLTIKKLYNVKKTIDIQEIKQKIEKQITYIQENTEFVYGEKDIYLNANTSEKSNITKNIVDGTQVFYSVDGGKSISGMFGVSKKNVLLKNSKYNKFVNNLDEQRLNLVCSLSNLRGVKISRIPISTSVDEQEIVFTHNFISEPKRHVKFFSRNNKVREEQILYSNFGPETTKSKNENQLAFYSFNDFRTNSKIEKDFYYSIDLEIEDGYKNILDILYRNFRNSLHIVLEISELINNKRFISNTEKEASFILEQINKIEISSLINLKRNTNNLIASTSALTINKSIKNLLFYYDILGSFILPDYLRASSSDIENIYSILKINNSNPQRLDTFLDHMSKMSNFIAQILNYESLELDSLSLGLKSKKTHNKKRDNLYKVTLNSELVFDNIEKKTKVSFISGVDSTISRNPGLPQISFEQSGMQSVLDLDGRLAPKKFIVDNTSIRVASESPNSYYEVTQLINNLYGNPKSNIYATRTANLQSELGKDNANKLSLLEALSTIGIYTDNERDLLESNSNINNRIGANNILNSNATTFLNADRQISEKTEQDESILSLVDVLDYPQELSHIIYANLAQESNNKNKLNNITRAREYILYDCLTAKIQYLDIFSNEEVKDSISFKFKDLTRSVIQNLKNRSLICRVVESSNGKGNSKTFSDLKLEITNKYFILINDASFTREEFDTTQTTQQVLDTKEQNDERFRTRLMNNNFDQFLTDLSNTTILNIKDEEEIQNNISLLFLSNMIIRQPIQAATYGTNFARLDIQGVPSTRMNRAKVDNLIPKNNIMSQPNTTVNNQSATGTSERNLRINVPIASPTRTSGY